MKSFVFYGGKKIEFEISKGWNLLYGGFVLPWVRHRD